MVNLESIIPVLTLRAISTVSKHIGESKLASHFQTHTNFFIGNSDSEFVTIKLGEKVHLTDENFETSHDPVDPKFEPSSHDKMKQEF